MPRDLSWGHRMPVANNRGWLRFGRSRDRVKPPTPQRRRRGWFVRDLVILSVVAAGLFVFLVQGLALLRTREIERRTLVRIPEGAGFSEIAGTLEEAGLVHDVRRFKLAARVLGMDETLQAGAYEFGPRYSELELLLVLSHGEVATRKVTIPEGYRIEQIAALLEGAVGLDAGEFIRLTRDPEVIARLGIYAPSLEGYLYPDTYRVELNMEELEAIEMMTWETRNLTERYAARAESIGMTMHEALTLASIIEAEALFDRERPRISAVYHNRLAAGQRLEADPTVRYAKGIYHRKLYYSDLEFESPYNTYRQSGLPPGPIGSPGMASIRAALYPLAGCEDFFFIANGDGTHTFSRTFAEHVKARERISAEQGEEASPPEFSLDDGRSE
jgi:UPF0755 protein